METKAVEPVEAAWADYVTQLRAARRSSATGTVPVQDALPREVALARIAVLEGRFAGRVVHARSAVAAMSDGEVRSLLAAIEERVASA
jgi:hypothetical protein